MDKPRSNGWGYLLAALLGAIGGGILIVVATRAIPKMMTQIMSQMMPKMMPEMMQKMCEKLKASGRLPDT
jgi:hypothetical protein